MILIELLRSDIIDTNKTVAGALLTMARMIAILLRICPFHAQMAKQPAKFRPKHLHDDKWYGARYPYYILWVEDACNLGKNIVVTHL